MPLLNTPPATCVGGMLGDEHRMTFHRSLFAFILRIFSSKLYRRCDSKYRGQTYWDRLWPGDESNSLRKILCFWRCMQLPVSVRIFHDLICGHRFWHINFLPLISFTPICFDWFPCCSIIPPFQFKINRRLDTYLVNLYIYIEQRIYDWNYNVILGIVLKSWSI